MLDPEGRSLELWSTQAMLDAVSGGPSEIG
jgi:hypothetical protein